MTVVRWSTQARDDVDRISDYIGADSPQNARRVAQKLYEGTRRLKDHPESGRPGRVPETRELVYPGLPYVAVYRIKGDVVEIGRVLHGRQRWP